MVFGDDSCIGTEGRILEDDIVQFTGTTEGIISYKTVLGANREIPLVYCDDREGTLLNRILYDLYRKQIEDSK